MRRPLRSFLLALGALFVAACGHDDGLAPLAIAHLDLNASASSPTMGTASNGAPTIACVVTFHVASNGRADAQLVGGVFRWYAGADRSTPVDSSILSASDVAGLFGASQYGAGASDDVEIEVTAGLPFAASLELQYTGGRVKGVLHSTAGFTCGPSAAKVAPPTVTVSIVEPPAGQFLEPGKPITLHITASSAAGLWRALVGVTGPCEVHTLLNPSLVQTLSTDVTLDLPTGCALDRLVTVTAAALDAFGVETDVSTPTNRFLVDHTAPTVDVGLYKRGYGYADYGGPLVGDYFAGESIPMAVSARDNSEVRAIYWEVSPGGPRDSALFSGNAIVARDVQVPVRLSSGTFQLRVWARDASGNESTVLASAVDGFHAYPSTTLPVATVELSTGIIRTAVDERSGRVFVAAGSEVRIYAASTLALEQVVAMPFVAGSIDVTEGGDTLFAAEQYGSRVTMVELSGAAPRFTRLTKSGGADFNSPQAISVLSNGKVMVRESPLYNGIVEIDRATLATRPRTDALVSMSMARSLDRHALFVADVGGGSNPCIQRYDVTTDAFAACGTGSAQETGLVSTDATGSRVARGYTVYDADGTRLIRQLWLPTFAGQSYLASPQLSADGTELYVPYGNAVVRQRVSDGAIVDRIPLPFAVGAVVPAAGALVPTADGSALFVVSGQRLLRVALR